MIAYQEYNTKSPLNGLAAKWAAQNTNLLPIDPRNIAPPRTAATNASAAATVSLHSSQRHAPRVSGALPQQRKRPPPSNHSTSNPNRNRQQTRPQIRPQTRTKTPGPKKSPSPDPTPSRFLRPRKPSGSDQKQTPQGTLSPDKTPYHFPPIRDIETSVKCTSRVLRRSKQPRLRSALKEIIQFATSCAAQF